MFSVIVHENDSPDNQVECDLDRARSDLIGTFFAPCTIEICVVTWRT